MNTTYSIFQAIDEETLKCSMTQGEITLVGGSKSTTGLYTWIGQMKNGTAYGSGQMIGDNTVSYQTYTENKIEGF